MSSQHLIVSATYIHLMENHKSECSTIKQTPDLSREIYCEDREKRQIGGIRVPVSVLSDMSISYPESSLPTTAPIGSGVDIFDSSSDSVGQVYEGQFYPENGTQLHRRFAFREIIPHISIHEDDSTVRTVWTATPVSSLDLDILHTYQPDDSQSRSKLYDTALVNERLEIAICQFIDGDSSMDPLEPELLFFDLETGSEMVSCPVESWQFFEVPDELVASSLVDNGYSSSLLAEVV